MPTNDKSDNKSGIMAEDIKTMVMSLMREDSFTDRLLNLVTETVNDEMLYCQGDVSI